jgi:hypothetical protein
MPAKRKEYETPHKAKAAKLKPGKFATFKTRSEAMAFYLSARRHYNMRFETLANSWRVHKVA